MRPGVRHFVFGPEDTICYGGHFYTMSLMQNTLQSLVHSFVVGVYITNITHHPSRSLLRRIVLLYHIGLVEERFQPAGDVGYFFSVHQSQTIQQMLNIPTCQMSPHLMVCWTCYQLASWPSLGIFWIFVHTALQTKTKTTKCLPCRVG